LLLLSLRFRTVKTFAAATLALRFRTEQSFLGAFDETLRFAAGSRANRCFLRESEAAAAPMLVTKALSQDVMVLAFVPLFADPQGVAQSPLQSTNTWCMF